MGMDAGMILREDGRSDLPDATVVSRRDVTADLMVLRVRPCAPFTFVPGQYCTIGLGGVERPYSIVSAPHERALELFIEYVPEGDLTRRLWRLGPGDRVSLRPRAKGAFVRVPDRRTHLMIATVTGIAPFVSMVRDTVHRGEEAARFIVLQGASHYDEFGYRDELTGLAARHRDLVTYVPTVSRPEADRNRGWRGRVGRVETIVEDALACFAVDPATAAAYACGHPGMIGEVVRRLAPKGFRVKQERYWPG